MFIFSTVDFKKSFVWLEGDTEHPFWILHHDLALHVVGHDVLEYWCKRLVPMINTIDKDLIVSGNRELHVSLHEMQSTSFTQSVMIRPV